MMRPWSPAPSLLSITADATWRRGSAGVSSNWKSHKFTELTAGEFHFRPFWRLWGWQQPVAHWGELGRGGPAKERARGPNAFVDDVRKQKATLASVGGVSASKTGKSEEVPEEGATAGKMMFSIWNLLSSLLFSGSLPSLPKVSLLSPEIVSMQTEPSQGAQGETTP